MSSDSEHTTHVQGLFVRHGAEVKYFVLSLLPEPGEAEDVVQEVFLTATAKAHDFEEGTNFKSWVFAIARFKVLEYLRGKKREPLALSDETMNLLATEAAWQEFVEDEVTEQRTRKALNDCLGALPPKLRKLIQLVYQGGIKPGEAAMEVQWKPEAAYVGLSRARKQLRQCIEKKVNVTI